MSDRSPTPSARSDDAEAEAAARPEAEAAAEAEDAEAAAAEAAAAEGEAEGEAEAAEAQGRGAAPAVVNDGANGRVQKPKRRFYPRVDEARNRLVAIAVREEGQPEHVIQRPRGGDEAVIWKLYDQLRKEADQEAAEKTDALDALERVRSALDGFAPTAAAPAAGGAARGAPAAPAPAAVGYVEDALLGGVELQAGQRWQTKPLPDATRALIDSKFYIEIVHDVQDRTGRPYVPGGPKAASYCGALPHAVHAPKIGPHRDKATYIVGGSHDCVLTVHLRNRSDGSIAHEREVVQLLRQQLPAAEVATWGSFESSLIFYMELQFDMSVADSPTARIDVNPASPSFAFKTPPVDNKLLLPPEGAPYSGSHYEQQMHNGKVEWQFKPNTNVTTANQADGFHAVQFRLAVWPLNPYLNALPSMRATSLPFCIKATLHNDLKGWEHWVRRVGDPADAPPQLCPRELVGRFAPPNRRKRKGAPSAHPQYGSGHAGDPDDE